MKKRHLLEICTAFLPLFLIGADGATAELVRVGFHDSLSAYDEIIWRKSDYTNDSNFGCSFVRSNVTHSAGKMTLQITNAPTATRKFSCAEYQTVEGDYGYGTYSARIKAASGDGVVTGFFVFRGKWGKKGHHEIDFEFLGKNTRQVQLNYFNHGQGINGENESVVNLAFDASADYHIYAIKWSPGYVSWSIDGDVVRSIYGAVRPGSGSLGVVPDPPVKLHVNLWNVAPALAGWAGTFAYNTPVQASVDWIAYSPFISHNAPQRPF